MRKHIFGYTIDWHYYRKDDDGEIKSIYENKSKNKIYKNIYILENGIHLYPKIV